MQKQQNLPEVDKKATFYDLPLSKTTLQALDKMGFEHPTPIQEKTIPLLLKGKDVIGQARTGTGKTAAFGLPIIETYDEDLKHVQALVLAPTRELANQIVEEMEAMSSNRDMDILPVYGGAAMDPQVRALKEGVHMVVGTPGRVMDHMERGNLDLTETKIMVLDEADRMLDMGFIDDVEWILRRMPGRQDRHTLLFSATMPDEIRDLSRRFMNTPQFVQVSGDELTVPEIEQVYYNVSRRNKQWALTRILDNEDDIDLALIFCSTKSMCDRLNGDLKRFGYKSEAIHGDLPQSKRERVLSDFDKGKVRILIATDVAARGLDIDHITHVINYDLPDQEPEVYVHRIGRTGRAGRKGKAISFVSLDDKSVLKRIEMLIDQPITEEEPPEPKKGNQDKLRRQIDWDELADKYGQIHIEVNAGRKDGLTPFKLHNMVQEATRLPDHTIQDLRIDDRTASFSVPKGTAMGARNRLRGRNVGKKKLRADFESRETTVRTA